MNREELTRRIITAVVGMMLGYFIYEVKQQGMILTKIMEVMIELGQQEQNLGKKLIEAVAEFNQNKEDLMERIENLEEEMERVKEEQRRPNIIYRATGILLAEMTWAGIKRILRSFLA